MANPNHFTVYEVFGIYLNELMPIFDGFLLYYITRYFFRCPAISPLVPHHVSFAYGHFNGYYHVPASIFANRQTIPISLVPPLQPFSTVHSAISLFECFELCTTTKQSKFECSNTDARYVHTRFTGHFMNNQYLTWFFLIYQIVYAVFLFFEMQCTFFSRSTLIRPIRFDRSRALFWIENSMERMALFVIGAKYAKGKCESAGCISLDHAQYCTRVFWFRMKRWIVFEYVC